MERLSDAKKLESASRHVLQELCPARLPPSFNDMATRLKDLAGRIAQSFQRLGALRPVEVASALASHFPSAQRV